MKKVILWTLYVLVLAATVLCFVFPVQAKEVCNNVMEVLNTPFAIAGVSVTLGGLLSFVVSKYIMSTTKFGRKELDSIKSDFKETELEVIEFKEQVTSKVSEMEEGYNELKQDCDNKVTVMLDQFEDLQHKMLDALETIPNKKVQSIVAEYKEQYAERKEEIITKTINTNEYIDMKIAEMKVQFDEFMEKMKHEEANDNQAAEE